MKKYISILSLLSVFLLQSCDRSDLDILEERQNNQEYQNKELLTRSSSASEIEKYYTNENNSQKIETGDDDHPRDKQHWRIANDTISMP